MGWQGQDTPILAAGRDLRASRGGLRSPSQFEPLQMLTARTAQAFLTRPGAPPRFSHTIRIPISAGETPEIREA